MLEFNNVHTDTRGTIKTITGEALGKYEEATLLYTLKNYARGGCIHKHSLEYLCVLSGKIQLFYKHYMLDSGGDTDVNIILVAGQNFMILPNMPHYFVALEDSLVIEWGPDLEEKNEKYEDYRRIVDAINLGNI